MGEKTKAEGDKKPKSSYDNKMVESSVVVVKTPKAVLVAGKIEAYKTDKTDKTTKTPKSAKSLKSPKGEEKEVFNTEVYTMPQLNYSSFNESSLFNETYF